MRSWHLRIRAKSQWCWLREGILGALPRPPAGVGARQVWKDGSAGGADEVRARASESSFRRRNGSRRRLDVPSRFLDGHQLIAGAATPSISMEFTVRVRNVSTRGKPVPKPHAAHARKNIRPLRWEAASGQPLGTLQGHQKSVNSVACARMGRPWPRQVMTARSGCGREPWTRFSTKSDIASASSRSPKRIAGAISARQLARRAHDRLFFGSFGSLKSCLRASTLGRLLLRGPLHVT